MKWSNIRLIFLREFRDQLRDRRTMFTIAVLPLLLYPLLGLTMLQVAQFFGEHRSQVWVVGLEELPASPRLIEGERFAESLQGNPDAELVDLTARLKYDDPKHERLPNRDQAGQGPDSPKELRQLARERLEAGEFDAVLIIPPGFRETLAALRARLAQEERGPPAEDPLATIPSPEIITNNVNDASRAAGSRLESVLRQWRESLVAQSLTESKLPASAARPFRLRVTDIAPAEIRRAAMWSKILPFVVLIWALTGAFYPAIDLCAGEKERGTLETLLCCPAERGEIVWGKLLTVMVFSMATSLLNLLSMGVTGTFVIRQMQGLDPAPGMRDIGSPPFEAMGWLLLALIPIAALFSALSLAIAAFARSSKEGQYYLMPLLIITLPLMMLSIVPSAELNLGTSLIPVTGMLLLLQALVEGRYADALPFVIPVVGVTTLCCWLAIRWAISQFNNESVLFRESERWGLGAWIRHLIRDRGDTPSFAEGMLCGILLLVIGFFASLLVPQVDQWSQLAFSMIVLQVAMIATPVIIMALMLTRNPRRTLLLQRTSLLSILGAVALGVSLHPLVGLLGRFVQWLYPLNPDLIKALKPIETAFAEAPLWQVLLVVALIPAICEELAFRGFILSGLRRVGNRWTAIIVSSVFFGLAHGIFQQKLTTCVIGLIVGYLAVQTCSLWPCIVFHFTNNALVVSLSRVTPHSLPARPWLAWMFRETDEGQLTYRVPLYVIAAGLSVGLLWCFRRIQDTPVDKEPMDSMPNDGESSRAAALGTDTSRREQETSGQDHKPNDPHRLNNV